MTRIFSNPLGDTSQLVMSSPKERLGKTRRKVETNVKRFTQTKLSSKFHLTKHLVIQQISKAQSQAEAKLNQKADRESKLKKYD